MNMAILSTSLSSIDTIIYSLSIPVAAIACYVLLYFFEKKKGILYKYLQIIMPVILASLIALLLALYPMHNESVQEKDISERISTISNSLQTTSQELSNIQKELETRIEYVEELKEEASIAENFISLTEEQVNAVRAKINQEFTANSWKSTIISILINAFFFSLGFLVKPLIGIFRIKTSSQNKNISTDTSDEE